MVVKFLYTSGPNGHFPALTYNTGKMDKNKGELMKTANFGPLQGLGQVRPEDYRNYLKMVSATNKAVKKPQLHVAISAAGKSSSKEQLTDIATQWLERMGYGQQPYLLIFHKDTSNNHIHIVSTRVDKQGKKINDSYEQIRGQQQMNIVMGLDEKHNAQQNIAKALTYQFSTKAQFMMILESQGYSMRDSGEVLQVIKFGKKQGEVGLNIIEQKLLDSKPDHDRKIQLKAIFHKYAAHYSTELVKGRSAYRSDFSALLKEKFGIDLLFHASGDKPPYGYTIVDHTAKQVFKGGEIMPLKELLAVKAAPDKANSKTSAPIDLGNVEITQGQLSYYSALLKAALHNYPDLVQGLQHQGLAICRNGESFNLYDPGVGISIGLEDLLDEKDFALVLDNFSKPETADIHRPHHHLPGISQASDIDDEAIHGRNRRRKKKAPTNSR